MTLPNAFIKAIGLVVVISLLISTRVEAGNDFITTDLRVDDPSVSISLDYQVAIAPIGGPSWNFPTFTTGWISVNLDDEPGLFGHQFSQIGAMADMYGVYWFVFAEPGVECLRGSYTYWSNELNKYLGCSGNYGDLVGYEQFNFYELVTYRGQGFWIARVKDPNGTSYDVAKILSSSTNIYDIDVTMEEGFTQGQDPFEFGSFRFWHPAYNSWSNGFWDWPVSDTEINDLYASPDTICPAHYGAEIYVSGDPRYWIAGTGGTVCDAVLFPAHHNFLPILIFNN